MTDLRKAAEDLLEVVEAAIKAGDWKVDGACDPDSAIVRLRQALAQPVDAVNISQERVDETAKHEQEPVAWVDITDEGKWSVRFAVPALSLPDGTKFYTAPPKREWVGLTKEEFEQEVDGLEDLEDCWTQIEAKLKEKNKREWAGLTDEERQEIVRQEVHWSGICRAIEAKLKEKNT